MDSSRGKHRAKWKREEGSSLFPASVVSFALRLTLPAVQTNVFSIFPSFVTLLMTGESIGAWTLGGGLRRQLWGSEELTSHTPTQLCLGILRQLTTKIWPPVLLPMIKGKRIKKKAGVAGCLESYVNMANAPFGHFSRPISLTTYKLAQGLQRWLVSFLLLKPTRLNVLERATLLY